MDKHDIHRMVLKTALLKFINWGENSGLNVVQLGKHHSRDEVYNWAQNNLENNFFWMDPEIFVEEYEDYEKKLNFKSFSAPRTLYVTPSIYVPQLWAFENLKDLEKFKMKWV